MKQISSFFVFLLIFSLLFLGGVGEVHASDNTKFENGAESLPFDFSAKKIVIDNFKWSLGDYLTLASPQLTIMPATSSLFNFPGTANIIAVWNQDSRVTFMDYKIVLSPGQLGVKYETGKYVVLDATRGLKGKIAGAQDIYGPVGVKLTGAISFVGDAYIDLVNSSASGGQGKLEFPIRLTVPIPGFGDCFAYSKATADVFYQEDVITLKKLFLKNSLTVVTGEVTYNLKTSQTKVKLDIRSDSDKVKFLMSGVALVSGVTKLGSGHWTYEFIN